MKKMIEYIFVLGLSGILIIGLFNIILTGKFLKNSSRKGIMETAGALSTEETADSITSDDFSQDLEKIQIKYKSSQKVLKAKTEINLKALFQVKSSTSSKFVDGNEEDTFQIYVDDIMLKDGTSIYDEIIQNDSETSDEIDKPLYYNPDSGEIIFYNAGVYKFNINVCDNNGVKITKTFYLVADDTQ